MRPVRRLGGGYLDVLRARVGHRAAQRGGSILAGVVRRLRLFDAATPEQAGLRPGGGTVPASCGLAGDAASGPGGSAGVAGAGAVSADPGR